MEENKEILNGTETVEEVETALPEELETLEGTGVEASETVAPITKKKGKITPKKILKIAVDVIMYLFIAICVFGVVVSVMSKKDSDGTATIFGYQTRFVQSASMEKCSATDVSKYDIQDIPVKSAVFIEAAPTDANVEKRKAKLAKWCKDLRVGDVLTFRYYYPVRQVVITHRIVKIEKNADNEGYTITLKGDNKDVKSKNPADTMEQIIDTSQIGDMGYYNDIIGKVVGQSYVVGLFIYALKTPVGIVCIVILPCVLIILYQIFRIAGVFNEEKREKQKERDRQIKEKEEKQESEIEALKRQLELLQQSAMFAQQPQSQPQSQPQPTDGEPKDLE